MRLKLATRISARQFRRNPSLEALVNEACERYKETRVQSHRLSGAARVVEKIVYRDRPAPLDDTKLPRGWFRRLFAILDVDTQFDISRVFGDVPVSLDAERSDIANMHASPELRAFRNNIDRAIAKLMATRDQITTKMDADVKAAADERARQL